MKRLPLLLSLLLMAAVWSCKSGADSDPLFDAISEHVKPDTLKSIEVGDTVDLASVEKNLEIIQKEHATVDSIIASIPQKIKEAEERIVNAESELKNLKFKMFKSNWESIIATENQTITSLKQMMARDEEDKKRRNALLNFTKEAKEKAVGEVAYYIVSGEVNDSTRRFFVTPSYEFLTPVE